MANSSGSGGPEDVVQFREIYATGPEQWVPAETEVPDAVGHWKDIVCAARERLGGDWAGVRSRLGFEVNRATQPPIVRILFDGRVLPYSPEFILEGVSFIDDILESTAVDLCAFEPIQARDAELARHLLDRYASLFVREAGFPATRITDARKSIELSVTTDTDPPIVRCTSHLTGEMQWLHDWDESPEMILSFVEEQAYQHAGWVETEREMFGRTDWDV